MLVILLVIIAAGLFAFMVLARKPNHGGGKPAKPAPAASEQIPKSSEPAVALPDTPPLPAGLPGTPVQPRSRAHPENTRSDASDVRLPGTPVR